MLALYAIPVALVGWRFGRLRGLATAAVAGAGWAAAHGTSGGLAGELLVWNALNRLAVFAFIAFATDLLARWSFLAGTDPLTGLLNRRAFVDRLRKAALRARRLETPLAIAFLDQRFQGVTSCPGASGQSRREACQDTRSSRALVSWGRGCASCIVPS